MSEMENILCNR